MRVDFFGLLYLLVIAAWLFGFIPVSGWLVFAPLITLVSIGVGSGLVILAKLLLSKD